MFPKVNPKQSFPRLEEEVITYWKENDTFKKSIDSRADSEEFNFYDGPPFATGTPHYGHILAGTIKDVVPRYQTMLGRKVERNFGWDCHGLPIENIVEKKLGISGKDDIEGKIGVYEFNETCRANVFGYVDDWKKIVERMGRWVDMENDYKTMDTSFMESVWWVFKNIYDKGLVYEGHRVVPYCPRCTTPLSNFEVNQGYKDKQSKTVTVKFKVKNGKKEICYKDSTGIVVKNTKGQVLLGKKKSNGLFSFPGGKTENCETQLNCIKRELLEETGLELKNEKLFSCNTSFSNGQNWKECVYEMLLEDESLVKNPEVDKYEHWKFYDINDDLLVEENFEVHSYNVFKQIKGEKETSKYHKDGNKYILAWTTTPWTLYANLGLAVGEDIDYVELLDKTNGDTYILAEAKVKDYYKKEEDYEIMRKYKGVCLAGIQYEPIFADFDIEINDMGKDLGSGIKLGKNAWSVVLGHHVTTETGTGIVHIAPAYGEDDFIIGEKEDLGFVAHIDDSGKTYNLLDKNGKFVFDFNEEVIAELKEKKLSISIGTIVHSYPHCWRCDTPLIYRGISAWYVAVEQIRDRMVANNEKINWVPDVIKNGRFGKWIENARDWNISRNRYWGSAIPVWQSEDKKEEVCIGSIDELYELNKNYSQITKVIFVRHGKTDYNGKKLMDYQDKARLTDEGKKQAENIKKVFKGEKIEKIYCSPLTRCIDTITPLSKELGIDIEIEKDFCEVNTGVFQDKVLDKEWITEFDFDDVKIGDGESIKDTYKRVSASFEKIIKENKGKTIVICSHGEPLVLMKKFIKDFDYKKDKAKFVIDNKGDTNYLVTYVYSESLREIDLHKHFVDEILIKNDKNFKAKRVLGIHGFKRNPDTIIDFFDGIKNNLEKQGLIIDTPKFEEGSNINYKNWEKVMDDLDFVSSDISINFSTGNEKLIDDIESFSNYDTVFTHSMGGRFIIEYIIEHKIKLDRLVMVAPGIEGSGTKEVTEFYSVMKNKIEDIDKYVKDIIVLVSKDDTKVRAEQGQRLAKIIGATLVEVDGYGHFNVIENKIIEGLIMYGSPLKRIPEVLDCWFESGAMPYASKHYPFDYSDSVIPEKAGISSKVKQVEISKDSKNIKSNISKDDIINSAELIDSVSSTEGQRAFKFPAEFIAEGLDQTRGWFYTLLILGTALFDNTPFLNCIVNGIVLAEDGKKMSKSLKNYPDPNHILDTYGADAMRFYLMNSPVVEAQDLRFVETGVEEVVKKVILPLWNTYSFFTTYANIDKFNPSKTHIYYCRHGETFNNAKKLMSGGDDDSLLTPKGEEQARLTGKKFNLSGGKIDVIISSSKDRARKTAELIASEIGYKGEIVLDERLIEQREGIFKGMTHDDIRQFAKEKYLFDIKTSFETRKFFKDGKYNEVEDIKDFKERVLDSIKDIENKYAGKNVLVVAHAGTYRVFNSYINNLEDDEAFYGLATIDNANIFKLPKSRTNILDKWIISELNKLILDVSTGLNSYKLNEAVRPIVDFMDNLTNWYIRRSRKRFWKSENDSDKIEAYETLYEVLVELCKVLAPVMPFVSEHIYRNLTSKESVHLDLFPKVNKSFILNSLNSSFDKTAKLINLGLASREKSKIRVRQPLSSIKISENLDDYYIEMIKEELNVKTVTTFSEQEMPKRICKPNARLIGPKYGKDVKFIIEEAKNGNFEELEDGAVFIPHPNHPLTGEGNYYFSYNGKIGFRLEIGEFDIEFKEENSSFLKDIYNEWWMERGYGMVVKLNTKLTPELLAEGYARDLVRYIQETRKEAKLEVDDRIEIVLETESLELGQSIEKFKKYIQDETLSTIVDKLDQYLFTREVEIEAFKVKIVLKK